MLLVPGVYKEQMIYNTLVESKVLKVSPILSRKKGNICKKLNNIIVVKLIHPLDIWC